MNYPEIERTTIKKKNKKKERDYIIDQSILYKFLIYLYAYTHTRTVEFIDFSINLLLFYSVLLKRHHRFSKKL